MKKSLQTYISEIRFKSDSKILDIRGEIANTIFSGLLDNWRITDNRIDFGSQKDTNVAAFFSFKNLGFISRSPHDSSFFIKNALEYYNSAWKYFSSNEIERIGVRSTFFFEVKDSRSVLEVYSKKIFNLTDGSIGMFEGKIEGVGYTFKFKLSEFDNAFFEVATGPARKVSTNKPEKDDNSTDNAVYVDIDFYIEDYGSRLKKGDFNRFVKYAVKQSHKYLNSYKKWFKVK